MNLRYKFENKGVPNYLRSLEQIFNLAFSIYCRRAWDKSTQSTNLIPLTGTFNLRLCKAVLPLSLLVIVPCPRQSPWQRDSAWVFQRGV